MKKHVLRRFAAAVSAFTIIASAMPITAMNVAAEDNIIQNSSFDSGTKGWEIYKESGGACTLTTNNGRLALNITNVSTKNYGVQVSYPVIPLYKNGQYRLKFDISCTTNRFVEGMIQQNGGEYQAYTWKGLDIGPEVQTITHTFTMEYDTDITSKLCFNCGKQDSDPELPEHTIYIDNVSLELLNPNEVNMERDKAYEPDINVNQVGYRPDAAKIAVFRNTEGGKFSVVNASTKEVVLTDDLTGPISNSSAKENNYIGDFSSVKTPGKYYITCSGLDNSYTFEIGDNVYSKLIDSSVRMLYLQRCGVSVEDDDFGHAACHTSLATVYGTNQKIDVSGGWHDAGDYGRYVVPAAKSIADLLYAYGANPSLYSDNINIPESGNGVPDILDEARFELEWMLKMQDSSGGVHHKVSCANFPGFVMPENETNELIVTPISSTATADFCAALALAYEFYKPFDSEFAQKCLTAAEKAWEYLEANPNFNFTNPPDIATGDYGDFKKSDKDERFWAAAQLYRATGNEKYLSAAESISVQKGLGWSEMGDYGSIALLTMKDIDKSSAIYNKAKSTILSQADDFVKISKNQGYGVAITKYDWGSNMNVADAGIIMSIAYQLTNDSAYLKAAECQLNYLLGTNPLGTCFVTGFGTVSPQHPHHRPSVAKKKAMPGMLVGGVDQSLDDDTAIAYCSDAPAAKRYIDHSDSYSTNEITIYWNSPLTYLLTVTAEKSSSEEVTLWGDANCDGNVNMADAVLVMQSIANADEFGLGKPDGITSLGAANADVYENGSGLTMADANSIQAYSLELINELPESYKKSDFVPTPVTTTTSSTTSTSTETTTTTSAAPAILSVYPDYGTPMNSNATLVADFRKGQPSSFIPSNGWSNQSVFNCFWHKENTSYDGGVLNLTIDKQRSDSKYPESKNYPYSAAEYRTNDFYGYGYYETSMQAIKNDGVVSSFFTYTGKSDGNQWDEIDIEVLGKDTTKVQFNYYTNGKADHEYMHDLGFDASQGFHTYGFDWQPDHITWYIDGVPAYTATDTIPKTPGKIMMNVWPGITVDGWLKPFDGKTPLTARYQWVTYNRQ